MARELVVRLIGDASSLNKTYREAATNTKKFQSEMTGVTAVVTRGGGALQGYGKHLAALGVGYLGITGIKDALETTVSAAVDAGKAQRSLAAQMQAVGQSFTANRAQVEHASVSLEKYGFTIEDSQKALTVLERGTGNITKAISLQGTAANLARAKNIDLASAANVLAKVFGGQESALRRAVPGLDKTAHGMDLVREAAQKLQGQAQANTTVFDQFHATLHNTEVIVGTALLPTITKLLGQFTDWLDKMNRTGQLQKDVNNTVQTATTVFGDLKNILEPLAGLFKTVGDTVGGTKNEVELLVGAFVALKAASIAGWVSATVAGFAAVTTAAEATAAAEGEAAAGAGAAGAIPAIATPPGLIAAAGAAGLYMQQSAQNAAENAQKAAAAAFKPGDTVETTLVPRIAKQIGEMFAKGMKSSEILTTLKAQLGGSLKADDLITEAFDFRAGADPKLAARVAKATDNAAKTIADGIKGIPGKVRGQTFQNPALSAGQQRQIGLASDPNNLTLLRQEAQADKNAIAFAEKLRSSGRISNAKYVSEVKGYASDLQQTNSTIASILEAARQAATAKTQAAAAKTKAAADAARVAAAKAQQNLLDQFQYKVDRTQLTPGLKDDLAALETQKGEYQKIIRTEGATHDLLETLLGIELAISAKKQEIADARAAGKQAQADKAAKQVQAKLDAANLLVAKAGLTETLKDDLAANQNLLAVMKKTGASAIDIVNQQIAINDLKGQLADQITAGKKTDDKAADTAAQANQSSLKLFKRLSATSFVNQFGAGLTGAQKRRLEVGFAMTGPGGTLPAGHSGQFTAGVTINGGVHMHGVQDMAGLENQLAKRAKARPQVRRGARG